MGIIFTSKKSELYLDEIEAICKVIKSSNPDLIIIKSTKIPRQLIESYITIKEEAQAYLKTEYNEDIDSFQRNYYLNGGSNPKTSHIYILAIKDNSVIGFQESWFLKESDECELTVVFINHEKRGKRIGKLLIGELILECDKLYPHKNVFKTNTMKNNLSTLKVISNFGFKDKENNHAICYFEVGLEKQ